MDNDNKGRGRRSANRQELDDMPAILAIPLHVLETLLSKSSGYLKAMAPQLITIAVCLLLVPLLVSISAFAGWFVWKNVATGWETPAHLQYGDGVPPYAEISLPSLVAQQAYDISLHLTIPATESNFALGNFMTTLTLSTPSNRTLTSIRRPAIASPATKSLFSSQPTLVELTVPLLSSFVPGASRVIAKLELGRRDSWKSLGEGHGRELSVFSASLRGAVRLQGLRGLITRFPLVSALTSSIVFFAISLLALTAFVLPALSWPSDQVEIEGEPVGSSPPEKIQQQQGHPYPSDDSEDEKPWTGRRITRRRTSFNAQVPSDVDVKTETSSTIIPESSASTSSPLRRRRSRLSQNLSDDES